jgi:hypothetical protein
LCVRGRISNGARAPDQQRELLTAGRGQQAMVWLRQSRQRQQGSGVVGRHAYIAGLLLPLLPEGICWTLHHCIERPQQVALHRKRRSLPIHIGLPLFTMDVCDVPVAAFDHVVAADFIGDD